MHAHERIGQNRRRFHTYKFRTMKPSASGTFRPASENDDRITKIGKLLRATAMDELPQLINVIKGAMSLVGPRPLSLRDVSLFDKGVQRKRFSVRPGITGLWQVSGRSNLSFDK